MQVRTLRTIVAGRPAITTARTSTLVEAARLMKERNIGSLLVLEGSRLAGIFTERDALFRVLAAARETGAIVTAGLASLPLAAQAQVNKNSKLRIFQIGVGGIGGLLLVVAQVFAEGVALREDTEGLV